VVAQFLRLKLTLLANILRRSTWQLIGMILAILYGLGITVSVTVALIGLRTTTPEIAHSITVVFGSVVVLAFLLLPLVFGVDDTLDPRKFSLYGIPTGRLAVGLAAAAAISVPTVVVAVFSIAQVVTWTRGIVPVLLALIAAIVIVPTCILAGRVTTAIASFFLSSRRARDASAILLLLALAAAAPLVAIFAGVDWGATGLPIVRRIAAVVGWTPLGAAWSVPGDAAVDDLAAAAAKLLIAVAFLALLWFAWRGLVSMMLVTQATEAGAKKYTGLGWFEQFPTTPTGAVAARSLTYWIRDARYRVSLVVIPIVPIVMVVALNVAGVPWPIIAWVPVPVMCLFLGWSIHNDIAYDSTAFWTHVSSNTSGQADRWGRVIPALIFGIPLVVVGSLVTVGVADQWVALPGLIGLSAGVLGVGLGISSVISAAFPYPAVRPGDSPFAQPQAAGTAGSFMQALSFFLTTGSAIPVVFFVFLGDTTTTGWYWVALGVGLLLGLVVLLGGIAIGARIVSRRAPEILAFTLQN
jgi:ABC-2 type transport system permease protein